MTSGIGVLQPTAPLSAGQLGREEIRRLARLYGQQAKTALRRFMSLLPEILRLGIYQDEGCASIYEYAAKLAGMRREDVDRVLALHRRLGVFPELWQLLADAVIGCSTLVRVAAHVTADNAAWWAEQLRRLSRAQVEELLRRSQRPQGNLAPAHQLEQDRPIQAAVSAGSGDPSTPCASAVAGTCAGDPASAQVAGCSSAKELESASDQVQDIAADAGLPESEAAADDIGASPHCRVRLTLEMDALDAKRARELLDLHERINGEVIGIGELFGRLVRMAIARGELPDAAPGHETAGCHGAALGCAAAAQSPAAAGLQAASASEEGAQLAPPLTAPGRKFRPRLLEVVVSVAETGWRFVRTSIGWVPADIGALTGFASPGQPVSLDDLRQQALAAAQGASARHRPAAVDRYILVRSGGYCEFQGCDRRMVDIHHRQRYAFHPAHPPDDLVAVCRLHHDSVHAGLVRNEGEDPGTWQFIELGQPALLDSVDHQVQDHRAGRVA